MALRFPPADRLARAPSSPHPPTIRPQPRQTDRPARAQWGKQQSWVQPSGVVHKENQGEGVPLTSSASKVTKLVMANPSMMSSSAEVDSLRFLRGGLGRDGAEDGGFPLSSLSEPDDEASEGARVRPAPPPPAALAPSPPRERLSRSRCDRDRRFLRSPWPRVGPSMALPRRGLPARRLPATGSSRGHTKKLTPTPPSPVLGFPPPEEGAGRRRPKEGREGKKERRKKRGKGRREGGGTGARARGEKPKCWAAHRTEGRRFL